MEGIELAKVISGAPHCPVVYFLRAGTLVKIGTSTRLLTRVSDLSLSLADVALIMPGGYDVEDAYHKRFARQRVRDRREWFRVAGELLTFLTEHSPPPPIRKSRPALIAPGGPGVGLTVACESGLLAISLDAARAARKRDRRFPDAVGRAGSEFLYDPAALMAWQTHRPRSRVGPA
jgi:hypothetical protein